LFLSPSCSNEEFIAMMRQFQCFGTCFLTMSVAGTGLAIVPGAMAADPAATIIIEVNGEPAVVLTDDFQYESGGYLHFVNNYVDPDGRWTVKWNYSVDPNPLEGVAAFVGRTEVINTSGEESDFTVMFEVPLCPPIEGPSVLGAFVKAALHTGDDGGMMQDIDQQAIWSFVADGVAVRPVFVSPFLLSFSGNGVTSFSTSFGSPFPSEPAAPIHETAGLLHQFSLTDGDTTKITTSLYIGADMEHLGECTDEGPLVGDLNQDGIVDGTDLFLLLSAWGPCQGCNADLTGDGEVAGQDLLLLLSNWG